MVAGWLMMDRNEASAFSVPSPNVFPWQQQLHGQHTTATSKPVFLVGPVSPRDELRVLATELNSKDIFHMRSLLGENWSAKHVRTVLETVPASAVILVTADELIQPGVKQLLGSQPFTVHVAVDPALLKGENHLRNDCKSCTRYTVIAGQDLKSSALQLKTIVQFARRPHPTKDEIMLAMGRNSFFLSLTFPDMKKHISHISKLVKGLDAVELRVDLLEDRLDPYKVLEQVQALRSAIDGLPIVFTVRSEGQCGQWPDGDTAGLFELSEWGLRVGVEYLDLESNWPIGYRRGLIKLARCSYPATLLIGSYHAVGMKTSRQKVAKLFRQCLHNGSVDAVKVVTTAYNKEDNWLVHDVAYTLNMNVPYIGLSLGKEGQLSRVLNERFTPVTHTDLPSAAAPGQMTSDEVMSLRKRLGLLPPRKFYLFGFPISHSPSPDMHNAGFQAIGLPYEYGIAESSSDELMASTLEREDFGGGSVTVPHKQNVLKLLDVIETAAKAIGAVNTIVVDKDPENGSRVLRGENTDWLGIARPIHRKLAEHGRSGEKGMVALVIGGGGAARAAVYAMKMLDLTVVVYNRTFSKAKALAESFGAKATDSLEKDAMKLVGVLERPDVVVSTIPATAEFTLPDYMVSKTDSLLQPVVFDAAYKPVETALLKQARNMRCPFVQGAEMLIEQGVEQFQLWTGHVAPRAKMTATVYDKVEKLAHFNTE